MSTAPEPLYSGLATTRLMRNFMVAALVLSLVMAAVDFSAWARGDLEASLLRPWGILAQIGFFLTTAVSCQRRLNRARREAAAAP